MKKEFIKKTLIKTGIFFLLVITAIVVSSLSGCAEKVEEEFEYTLRSQRFNVVGYRELNSTNSFLSIQGSLILELSLDVEEYSAETVIPQEQVIFYFVNFRDLGTRGTCTGTYTSVFSEGRADQTEDTSGDPFADYNPDDEEDEELGDAAQRLTVYYKGAVSDVLPSYLGATCSFVVYPETFYFLRLYENGDIIIGDGQRNIEHLIKPI